jgi:hypothetical protein
MAQTNLDGGKEKETIKESSKSEVVSETTKDSS